MAFTANLNSTKLSLICKWSGNCFKLLKLLKCVALIKILPWAVFAWLRLHTYNNNEKFNHAQMGMINMPIDESGWRNLRPIKDFIFGLVLEIDSSFTFDAVFHACWICFLLRRISGKPSTSWMKISLTATQHYLRIKNDFPSTFFSADKHQRLLGTFALALFVTTKFLWLISCYLVSCFSKHVGACLSKFVWNNQLTL